MEIAVELAGAAQANVSLNPAWRERITVVNEDATRFAFPAGPLVLYFYNPFYTRILRRVLANLERELRNSPRAVYLVFADIYGDEPAKGEHHRFQDVLDATPRCRRISDTTYPLSTEEVAAEPSRGTVSRFTVYSFDVKK